MVRFRFRVGVGVGVGVAVAVGVGRRALAAVDADGRVDTAALQHILKQELGKDLPLAQARQIRADSTTQLAMLQLTGRG